jgi:predicted transcriptional regulator YdeE/enterochelin esterase-like enzyme
MKLTKYLIASSLLVSAIFTSGCAVTQKDDLLTVDKITMHSASLEGNVIPINTERELIVVLPPSYHSEQNKTYPVVYLLHGLGAKAEGWFSAVEGEPNIEVALQRLYKEQQISEMIVVVPNSYNEFALGGWYSNSTSGGNWEDYIIKDVIPYIDERYRTNTEKRGLAGGSMGGYGAFRLAMKHPKMFEAIYALSAALGDSSGRDYMSREDVLSEASINIQKNKDYWTWTDSYNYSLALSFAPNETAPLYVQLPFSQTQVELFKDNSLDRLLEDHLDAFKKDAPVIKFDVGTGDYLKTELRLFSKQLKKAGIEAAYSEYLGGHSDKLGLLAEHEIFQFFSMYFTDTLPTTLPDSLSQLDLTSSLKPTIVTLPEFEITASKNYGRAGNAQFMAQWNQLFSLNIDRQKQCKNNAYLGFSDWTNDASGNFHYFVGCEKNKGVSLPEELNETKRVPTNKYAVFTYKGTINNEYSNFFSVIYQQWLPASGYQQAGEYNFELSGENFTYEDESVEISIYVPIK